MDLNTEENPLVLSMAQAVDVNKEGNENCGCGVTVIKMDSTFMEIIDMRNNEHYMVEVNADATLFSLERVIRDLAHINDNSFLYLFYECHLIDFDEYIHPLIKDNNNSFYLLTTNRNLSIPSDTPMTPEEERASQFISFESKIAELNTEITELKIKNTKSESAREEYKSILHAHGIELPEDKEKQKQEAIILEKEKEQEAQEELVSTTVHLKWAGMGVEGVRALITEINKFSYTSLEVLDLRDCHMGDEGCELLSKVFSQGWSLVNMFQFYFSPPTLPRLHSIILYGNGISSKGANTLIHAFKYLPQVELLGLEVLRRRLSAKEERVFFEMHLDSLLFSSLSLDLSNLNLVDNFLVQFSGYVEYLISTGPTTIRKLFFNNNKFKARGVMMLSSLIADCKIPNLEFLNLEHNLLDEEAIQFLACAIHPSSTPHLKELYLGDNAIGEKGVCTLFRYFRKMKVNSIEKLSLKNTLLGYEGIKVISNSVLFNTMMELKSLDISHNLIDSRGFIMILKCIERGGLPKLERLDLNNNRITNDGCEYLLAVLSRSPLGIINDIELYDNPITPEEHSKIQQVLSGQDHLKVVLEVTRVF